MTRIFSLIAAVALTATSAFAAELGDDGLYKEPWFRTTFKDLQEDLADAGAEDKRLLIMIEQRGCIYCTKMHEEVFSDPKVKSLIEENFFVVQINMFGDVEVTDFDGESMPEKRIVQRWGALFTPTMMFFPEEVGEDQTASQAAVAAMPGAFGLGTTIDLLNWVLEKGYESDEGFQSYHRRKIIERQG